MGEDEHLRPAQARSRLDEAPPCRAQRPAGAARSQRRRAVPQAPSLRPGAGGFGGRDPGRSRAPEELPATRRPLPPPAAPSRSAEPHSPTPSPAGGGCPHFRAAAQGIPEAEVAVSGFRRKWRSRRLCPALSRFPLAAALSSGCRRRQLSRARALLPPSAPGPGHKAAAAAGMARAPGGGA